MTLTEHLLGSGNVETGVVGLDESLLDLSILNEKNVALAAVVAEDGAAVEAEVEGLGELARGVTEEANAALAGGIEGISPSLGHEWVVDRDDESLTSLLELGVVDEAGNVGAGAGGAEGGRSANDNSLVLDLLGQVDLVTGGVLDQDVQAGDGVALLHERGRGAVEEGCLRANAGDIGCDTAGEHDGFNGINGGIGLIVSKE